MRKVRNAWTWRLENGSFRITSNGKSVHFFSVRPSASFLDLQAADAQQPQQTRVFAQMPLFSGTSEAVTFATVAPLMLQKNPGLTVGALWTRPG